MSSTKSQVAVATNIPNLSSQSQREYSTEESLGRQSSFGNNRRGNMKGKHLTRSHAMRESTSPPRTPTPRAEHAQVSPSGQATSYQQQQHHAAVEHGMDNVGNSSGSSNNNNNNNFNNNNNNNNKLHAQSNATRGNSPNIEAPTVIVTSQYNQQQQQQLQQQQTQQQQQQKNVALSNEMEFPKLSPPKSTKASGSSNVGTNGNVGAIGGSNTSSAFNACGSSNANTNAVNSVSQQRNFNNGNAAVAANNVAAGNIAAENHNKSEYNGNNNSNNNNNNGNNGSNGNGNNKKLHIDAKSNVNGNGNGNVKQQQQHHYNANNNNNNIMENAGSRNHGSGIYNSGMNYQCNAADANATAQSMTYEKENRCPRNDSQNSNNSNNHDEEQHYERNSGGGGGSLVGGGGGGKKHRINSSNSNKTNKPRLKNMSLGSSSSVESSNPNSNNTSGFISRVFNNSENSGDQFTDHGGTDLLTFFKETLNKSLKDRNLLLKIEKDLSEFMQDKSRSEMRFPSASSYNRMLIHRTAAFFGMDHNVDTETQQCVIVAPTKNTRMPDISFKSLLRDHRDESRKSILKRDTHSFDEARQSSYLCPDRGMLDRKAKSFEEREEDYERARSRIFNRSQNEHRDLGDDAYANLSWTNQMEQQQTTSQQQQQQNRSRVNGKMLKMQSSTESRDGRNSGGAVPKTHSFGGYAASANNGSAAMLRSDSNCANKSTAAGNGGIGNRNCFANQDATGSNSTQWRLSPLSSGTIYHFDPANLPPNQAVQSGVYTPANSSSNNINNMNYNVTQQQQTQTGANGIASGMGFKKTKPQLVSPQNNNAQSELVVTSQQTTVGAAVSSTESLMDSSNVNANNADVLNDEAELTAANVSANIDADAVAANNANDKGMAENLAQNDIDEHDSAAVGSACVSVTTTTSTKNYDRIEVQKFKNQSTSPKIPNEKEEPPKRKNSTSSVGSNMRNQDTPNFTPVTVVAQHHQQHQQTQQQHPAQQQQQHQHQHQQQQHRETPHSTCSTPYSNSDSAAKRSSEEFKSATWTYTQSYQAPDGSTVFHTAAPTSAPYCATTYQQAPDGSVYAIPQGMVYAYPPPVDNEVQGYFMPVFDPAQSRGETTSLIPAGAQAIYPATPGSATMVPVAAAYPTATQFATANGTPIYTSQLIYAGDQFNPAGAATVAAATAPATGQVQQIPMTTYPIGYPYPYNGYWGQTMTYYVPQQAVAAAPGAQVAGNIIATGTAAGGPSSASSAAVLTTANSGGAVGGLVPINATATGSFQPHTGTAYLSSGRVKRPSPSQYSAPQGGHQLMATIACNGGGTATYQLGHAVPTLALASPAGAAATNDLNATAAAAPGAAMYAVPPHATIFPTNMFPYAAASAGVSGAAQAHNQSAAVAPSIAAHAPAAASAAHVQQSNAVITPFYAHHPQVHQISAHPQATGTSVTVHAPGPAAIPIIDPATLVNTANGAQLANSSGGAGSYSGATSTSQSAPSTPHSAHVQLPQRNAPLFSTPPMSGGHNSTMPHYITHADVQASGISHSHNNYTSTYERRNNSSGKKPPNYAGGGGNNRQNSSNSGAYSSGNKVPLLSSNNEMRTSPNNCGSSNSSYQSTRSHHLNKRGGGGGGGGGNEKMQAPLLSAPPIAYQATSTSGYHVDSTVPSVTKPPSRLNASAAAFRTKASTANSSNNSGMDFRRSVSQRNSPNTNSSSNEPSNNSSPNGNVPATAATPTGSCYTPSYVNTNVSGAASNGSNNSNNNNGASSSHNASSSTGNNNGGSQSCGGEQQTATTSVYIARGTHIPPQMQHGSAIAAAHHQPLLGTYNPGASSGLYFKYGQTYFAHPSVALPNSRRSPSTDLRPPMTQMTGMFPTVNMMIPAPPRHTQGRNPNPNYKGNRPH